MTYRPNAFPDSPETGKQAMLEAERALHERMMGDPRYAARQPTERELAEYAAMDAREEAARQAYLDVESEMGALSRSAPEGARLAGPLFSYREVDPGFVDQLGRNTVAHEAAYTALANRRVELMDAEADIRTANNQRRAEIALAQSRRG